MTVFTTIGLQAEKPDVTSDPEDGNMHASAKYYNDIGLTICWCSSKDVPVVDSITLRNEQGDDMGWSENWIEGGKTVVLTKPAGGKILAKNAIYEIEIVYPEAGGRAQGDSVSLIGFGTRR